MFLVTVNTEPQILRDNEAAGGFGKRLMGVEAGKIVLRQKARLRLTMPGILACLAPTSLNVNTV